MRGACRNRITCCAGQRDLALRCLCAALAAWLLACRSGASQSSQASSAKPAPSVAVRPRAVALAHASTFELVATSEGAVLVWAAPGTCKTGVSVQRLAADGSSQQPSTTLDAACGGADSDVMELTAAAGGGRLSVAFIVESQDHAQARVVGSQAADSAQSFAPALQLGAAEPTGLAERGRVELVASEGGQMRIAWHAPRAPCVGESGSCAQLVSEPYPPAVDAAARRTDTREIPEPCSHMLVGAVWTEGVWYDAFCARGAKQSDGASGSAVTQVYSIRPEIFYAEADPTLQDCEPLGLAPSRTGSVAWGRCSDGLRAHLLAPEGKRQILASVERSVACADGRPVLRLRGANRAELTFPLAGPRDRLELWLPPELASEGSRAVFTGRHLLVASPGPGGLVVHSHHCDTQGLVSEVSDARPML